MEVCRNDDDLGFLLMRFNQRDTSAFATIYMDFFTELHVYANRLYCNTSESAADAVQEAFCYLWERHDVIFDSLTKIKAFLFVAIKNRYKNHVNHLGVRQKYKDAMERETSFVEDVLDSELATSLLEYVEYIPDPEGKVMKLYLAGLDAEEIADHMKLSIRTVYNAKSRAVGMLKKFFSLGNRYCFKDEGILCYVVFVIRVVFDSESTGFGKGGFGTGTFGMG